MQLEKEGVKRKTYLLLTSSLWVTGKTVSVSSSLGGLLRSRLWLWDGRSGGFPSSFRTWRSALPADPTLSFLTGFVSHFFRVLTDRLELGELGAELTDGWGGSDATEVEMLPSLPAAEYESEEKTLKRNQCKGRQRLDKVGQSALFIQSMS